MKHTCYYCESQPIKECDICRRVLCKTCGYSEFKKENDTIVDEMDYCNECFKRERLKSCCEKCFLVSHDVKRGHLDVAVPDSCKDEYCDCHTSKNNYLNTTIAKIKL